MAKTTNRAQAVINQNFPLTDQLCSTYFSDEKNKIHKLNQQHWTSGTFPSIIHFLSSFPSFISTPIYIPPTTVKQNTSTAFSTVCPHPIASLLLSVTDLLLGKNATLNFKSVKAALAFSPLHIILAKLMLCLAIFIQAADSQPSPPPSSALARKSRLQRENVMNSMERKHTLSIIHVPLRC